MRKLFIVLFIPFAAACFDAPPTEQSTPQVGEALAATLACASCHGSDLSGSESPLSPGVYAANLTPDPTGLGTWSDDDVARAIQSGQDDEGNDLCSKMPRFTTLTSDETSALVAYLRSLPPIAHDIPESDCETPDLDDAGLDDAGYVIVTDDASSPSCTGYADPSTPSTCHACSSGQSTCQQNGCFGGYFCDLSTLHCVPEPDGC